jgi:large subunit ribosomal protein L32
VAVPKRRQSSTRRDLRRHQHDKVVPKTVVGCPNCESPMLPHRVCGSCGYYKGHAVLRSDEPAQS